MPIQLAVTIQIFGRNNFFFGFKIGRVFLCHFYAFVWLCEVVCEFECTFFPFSFFVMIMMIMMIVICGHDAVVDKGSHRIITIIIAVFYVDNSDENSNNSNDIFIIIIFILIIITIIIISITFSLLSSSYHFH